jgi:DNA-binding response OmpR family regulator
MAKILLVEDDRHLADTICTWLKLESYLVEKAETGTDALDLLRAYPYDLVILDVELPRLNGLEVCRQYRAQGGTSLVLMLTNKSTITDKEAGFGMGADDYLTKPFHLKELSARLRALLRRSQTLSNDVLTAGKLELDPRSRKLTRGGEDIHLPKMELALLEFFMRCPNQVFSSEALLERVWSSESERSSDTIRSCIKKLRNKIDVEGEQSMIKNVHGVGYVFEVPS